MQAEGKYILRSRSDQGYVLRSQPNSLFVRKQIASVDANPCSGQALRRGSGWGGSVGVNVENWQMRSQQSLWWGPGEGGAMLFSQNADDLHVPRQPRHAFAAAMDFRMDGTPEGGFFLWPTCGKRIPSAPGDARRKSASNQREIWKSVSAAPGNWVEWAVRDHCERLE